METVVGIFDNQVDAEKAVNEPYALGLPEDSIRVLRRGDAGGGGLFSGLTNAFSSGGDPVTNKLTRMGLSREEAEFYEEELRDEGRARDGAGVRGRPRAGDEHHARRQRGDAHVGLELRAASEGWGDGAWVGEAFSPSPPC